MTPIKFQDLIKRQSALEIAEGLLGDDTAIHVSLANQKYIGMRLAETFSTDNQSVKVSITGSAKLGFSIIEKNLQGIHLPRYRSFNSESDIDVAVVSSEIFSAIWNEIGQHFHQDPWFPKRAERLGDYMIYGWLRPDKFPTSRTLIRCQSWWTLFNTLSTDARFGPRKVRGGLFFSAQQLNRYQARAIAECQNYTR